MRLELREGDIVRVSEVFPNGAFKMEKIKEKVKLQGNMAIWCKNENEFQDLMLELEKRRFLWNNGKLPTQFTPLEVSEGVGVEVILHPGKKITYTLDENHSSSSPKEFQCVDFDQVIFPETLYNGKVVCIDATRNPTSYTVGKIYQFENGLLKSDQGDYFPAQNDPCRSFEDWQAWTTSKFIEVVE